MADKPEIRITVVGTTHVGKVREHNEDNFLVADLTAVERAESGQTISRSLGEKGLLVAVADGMGGAASGELASEMSVEAVYRLTAEANATVGKTAADELAAGLAGSLNLANDEIYARSQEESEHRGMGTTMTAAQVLGDDIAIAQVGDSRAYLLRKGKLTQVTKDQSLITQLIEDGTLTPEEAKKLGGQNIILQALGVEQEVSVETKVMEVLDGDVLLLCSDGLTGMVEDEDIERTIQEADALDAACDTLVKMANEAGGRDNITVILVRFEGSGLRAPLQPLETERTIGGRPITTWVPPDVPTYHGTVIRYVIFAVVAAAALFLAIFLSNVGVDVKFVYPAPGALATLTPLGDGDAIDISPETGKTEVLVSGIPPRIYKLTATLEHYKEAMGDEIEIKSNTTEWKIDLVPLPGDLYVRSETPRVDILIRRAGAGPDDEPLREERIERAMEPETWKVPAGDLVLLASRPGFEDREVSVSLPPEGTEEVTVEALQEIRADLVIECDQPGVKVRIEDDFGEELFSGTIPESGQLTAKVRIGKHGYRASHEMFEEKEGEVEIRPGVSTPLKIVLKRLPGTVLVKANPDDNVGLRRPGGDFEHRRRIDATGVWKFEVDPVKWEVVRIDDDVVKTVDVVSKEQVEVDFR